MTIQEKELNSITRMLTRAYLRLMAFGTSTTMMHAEAIDVICDDIEKYIEEIKNQGIIK